ncbi:MAG TPA: type 1 glutamine amidotransferase [Burkholderiaceae bacterium]|nr:type 1 glutamine amidotransferase [Burkholderiaceae bacterium]
MKPVVIVQHEAGVEPGNFGQHLRDRGRPFVIRRLFDGDAVPESAEPYAGLCSLGGNMSVNDDLPWIEAELALLRDADARGVSVIGHCLGGQLLARALGADVQRSPHVELGWGRLQFDDVRRAHEWLGVDADRVEYFQWHSDAFGVPAGGHRILQGRWCPNQAYVVERPGYAHIGMQFHIEMTPEMVRHWAADLAAACEVDAERLRTGGPAVQSPEEMVEDAEGRAARMRRVATHLYDRWLRSARW